MLIMDLEYGNTFSLLPTSSNLEHDDRQRIKPEHIGNPKIFEMDLTDDISPREMTEEDEKHIINLPPPIHCNKKQVS